MKRFVTALLYTAALLPSVVLAENSYLLYPGQPITGVTLRDGQSILSSQTICRNQECYQVYRQQPVDRGLLRRLGLPRYSFEGLAALPSVERRGEALLLPPDLGWTLYRNARNDEWASNSNR